MLDVLLPGLVVGVPACRDLDHEQHGKADEEPQRRGFRACLLERLREKIGDGDGEQDPRRHADGRAAEARADSQAGQSGKGHAGESGTGDKGGEESGQHGRRAYNARVRSLRTPRSPDAVRNRALSRRRPSVG